MPTAIFAWTPGSEQRPLRGGTSSPFQGIFQPAPCDLSIGPNRIMPFTFQTLHICSSRPGLIDPWNGKKSNKRRERERRREILNHGMMNWGGERVVKIEFLRYSFGRQEEKTQASHRMADIMITPKLLYRHNRSLDPAPLNCPISESQWAIYPDLEGQQRVKSLRAHVIAHFSIGLFIGTQSSIQII